MTRLAPLTLAVVVVLTGRASAQDVTPAEVIAEPPPPPSPAAAPVASSADAEVATVSPETSRYLVRTLGGDAPAGVGAEACDAVRATLAAEGFGVLEDADVAATIAPARLEGARRLDDLRTIATELGASAVATVAVWTSDGAADSVTVSLASGARSFSASETLGARSLSEAARDAVRGALSRQRNALLIAGSGASITRPDEPDQSLAPDADSPAPAASGPTLFGIIGPGFVAALGASGVGLGIYSSLDGYCRARGPMTGRCLIGEDPNYGLGVLFIVGGVLAIAGAIVWWVTGASDPAPTPRMDVVFLPEGGAALTSHGVF